MADDEEAKRLFSLGSHALNAGDHEEAHSKFSDGLEIANSVEIRSALFISRSRALVALEVWDSALGDAEACQKLRPSWSRTFECKAVALAGLGRSAEADASRRLAAALAALKQDPKNEELKQNVRAVRQEIAALQAPEALPAPLPQAPDQAPATVATAVSSQGASRGNNEESEEAKELFAKGVQASKEENYQGAHEHFSQSLSLASTVELRSALFVSRSAVLCSMMRFQEALEDAEGCIRIRKSWARSYSCQATALDGLGRSEEAGLARRLSSALADLKQDPKNEILKNNVRGIRQELAEYARSVEEMAKEQAAMELQQASSENQMTADCADGTDRNGNKTHHAGLQPSADTDLGESESHPEEAQSGSAGEGKVSEEQRTEGVHPPEAPAEYPPTIAAVEPAGAPDSASAELSAPPPPMQSFSGFSIPKAGRKSFTAESPPDLSQLASIMAGDPVVQPAGEFPVALPKSVHPGGDETPPNVDGASVADEIAPLKAPVHPVQQGLNNPEPQQVESEEAKAFVSQANSCQRMQDFQSAVDLYSQAFQHARNMELRSAILFNRSVAHARMRRWNDSLDDANQCVSINPNWSRGPESQGTALEGLGRFREALSAFETALSLDPNNRAIVESMDEIRQKLAAQDKQTNATGLEQSYQRADNEVPLASQNGASFAAREQGTADSRPRLVKASSYHGSPQQSFVQDLQVPGYGRVLKWTVCKWDVSMAEMSLNDVFPNFPTLAHHKELHCVHSVHVRGVLGSTQNSRGVTLKIPGPGEGGTGSFTLSEVVVDFCQNLTLLMDSVEDDISLVGCQNTTVVVGQRPAKSGIFVLNCTNCKVVMSRQALQTASAGGDLDSIIKTSACSEVYLVLVKHSHTEKIVGMSSIELLHFMQNRQQIEKIMLPDCFSTELSGGSVATQCGFVVDINEDRQRQASALNSTAAISQNTAAPIATASSPSLPPTALPPENPSIMSHGTGHGPEDSNVTATPFLGTSVLEFKLTLAIDGVSAGLLAHFESMLIHDLARASGIPADQIVIISLVENVITQVKCEIRNIDRLPLASTLENQVTEPGSKLRSGNITRFVREILFPFDLGSGAVGFKMKLGLSYQEAGTRGTAERSNFEKMYVADLCKATGASASQFRILQISPGSIVVETEIGPDLSGGSAGPRSILENLDRQAMNEQSRLRNGHLTRYMLSDREKSTASPQTFPGAGQLGPFDSSTALFSTPLLTAQNGPTSSSLESKGKNFAVLPDPSQLASTTISTGNAGAIVTEKPEETGAKDVGPSVRSPQSPVSESVSQGMDQRSAKGEKRVGIGIAIAKNSKGFVVADVVPHSPALAVGIQAGDCLESVDDLSLEESKLSEVVRLLRGPAGSVVKIDITRPFLVDDNSSPDLVRRTFIVARPTPGKNNSQNIQLDQSTNDPVKHKLESLPMPDTVEALPQLPDLLPKGQRISGMSKIGVGLGVARDTNGFIRVNDVLSGSASQMDGSIQRNDIIERVDNVSVQDMHPNDVVELLRGPENSYVKLDMRRNDWMPADGAMGLRYSVSLRRIVPASTQRIIDVPVSLVLDMAIWEIGDVEVFKREVCYDVARALGGSVRRVKAVGLRAGSVIVDLILTPQGLSRDQLLDKLAAQARDRGSPLMLAQHTCRTIAVSPGPSEFTETRNASPKADVVRSSERFRTRGTLGLSPATANKIMQEVDQDMRTPNSLPGVAPVPLVQQPESVARSEPRLRSSRTGIGLGLTAGKGLVYTVCGMTPGGAAAASGQFQQGDVVHSVDGVLVTGKTIGGIQEMVIGEVGSKVMIAVLRSDAVPEDLQLDLDQFERWRPVVLVRTAARSPDEGMKVGLPGVSPEDYKDGQTSSPARNRIWPVKDGREVIAVDLVLDEDFTIIAATPSDKASFCAKLTDDISTALSASSEQISVVDLQPGSVVAIVEFFSTGHNDAKDPEELAMQIMKQASDHSSPLRHCVSCRRARYARARLAGRPMANLSATSESQYLKDVWGKEPSSVMRSGGYGGGKWVDLGFYVSKAEGNRFCQVQELRPGGPAEQSACIFPGNFIISVDGKSMDEVPIGQVVEYLEQIEAGASINVGVLRPKGSKGALRDRDVTTVVALRRDYGQEASLLPKSLYAPEPMVLSQDDDVEFEYAGPCRVVVLQRRPDESRMMVGIGLSLQRSLRTGQMVVAGLLEGRPAAESGQIFVGDVLHQIDNVPTKGRRLPEVVKMIQGVPNSPVVLMVQRTRPIASHDAKNKIQGQDLDEEFVDDDVQDIPMISGPDLATMTTAPTSPLAYPEQTDTGVRAPLSPLAYPERTDTTVRPPLSPFSYREQPKAAPSPSAPVDSSTSPPEPSSPSVEKKADASMHVAVLAAEGLEDKATGDKLECKIRVLHPSRSPAVVGSLPGVLDGSASKALFGDASFDFQVPAHEIEFAQVEWTLWEEDTVGLKVFIGEVVVNVDRIVSLAADQPQGSLSQDFQFVLKEGWTFPTVRSVTGKLILRIACSTS